jgi:filamentous hemagglutinin family protein
VQEKNWSWRLKFAILLFFSSSSIAVFPLGANAQLIPDGTLSEEPSRVAPQGLRDLIEGGAIRDTTLFHSFREFNVNDAQQVYFANPDGIANILTRVTGNNISRILGTLGVLGSANLFLINPNGIIFGSNARLDVAGSFTATTADSVIFDNYEFSATNPEAPPLLTINVTPGLQYGSNHPSRTIRSEGILSVGQDLNLAAGNLYLESQLHAGNNLTLVGMDSVKIRDSSHQPFIASASGNLLVQGNQGVNIFALNHPDSGLFSGGDMVLHSANRVGGDAHYTSGGNFRIEQLDSRLGDLYSPNDPVIRANADVVLAIKARAVSRDNT